MYMYFIGTNIENHVTLVSTYMYMYNIHVNVHLYTTSTCTLYSTGTVLTGCASLHSLQAHLQHKHRDQHDNTLYIHAYTCTCT